MDTSVRDLKAQLSRILAQVQVGATVTVQSHGKPVAQLVPIRKKRPLARLASLPGIVWNGKKPSLIAGPEVMPKGVSLSDWVIEDRR